MDTSDPENPREAALATIREKNVAFAGVWNALDNGNVKVNDDYDCREGTASTRVYPVFEESRWSASWISTSRLVHILLLLPPNADGIVSVVSTPTYESMRVTTLLTD